MKTIPLKRISMLALSIPFSCNVFAHGAMEYPIARQYQCYKDSGYWNDSIPNEACQQAYDESGTLQFDNWNGFAANPENPDDQQSVEKAVPDGMLCSAGISGYNGINLPSEHWQKTDLAPGKHTISFHATAPHDPSWWRIYLSKEGFDSASETLDWDDLELITEFGNIVKDSDDRYRMEIEIPEGRTGTGILYVRWQREDSGNEGFYSCSDVRFSDDGGNPDPGPDPEPEPEVDPIRVGRYVLKSLDSAEPGDQVRFRLLNESGNEVVDTKLDITEANQAIDIWAYELAMKARSENQDKVQIGKWHDAMNHVMYDRDNVYRNMVWAFDEDYRPVTELTKADDLPPVPDYEYIYPEGIESYTDGTRVLAEDNNVYECLPFPNSGWCSQAPDFYAPATGSDWEDAWKKL
ncbi:lytic polysaccharide monooxygenase [Endozoicomonas arenosclerae]|uniref:lytic polysaccharide monooxygenase n=1 Tax=Endozoicomonas arenosclerae TaxID=1633495 RepID=UPI000A8698D9|nr:lytic polysaccharide monooxygenase [Endozoicomonas arenosclerae]